MTGAVNDIFFLFHRPRKWNPHDKIWMGYERKRGKLEQFNALATGRGKEYFSMVVGEEAYLYRDKIYYYP